MRGYIVYDSYQSALSALRCTYSPALVARHSIIKSTVNGEFIGWQHVLNVKPRKTLRKSGEQRITAKG